jgi:20S proteasome alpha/beta subunit
LPDEDRQREEDLTIGIAFRCNDGIVLAGDRFRKKGDSSGTLVTKVRIITPRKDLIGAMVAAGASRYIDAVRDRFDRALRAVETLEEAQDVIDRTCQDIYREYMKSDEGKEPHFSFLIALWNSKEGFRLLLGESGAPTSIIEDENYKAIGKGASLANCLVNTFYSLEGTCEDAAFISVMAVKLVNEFVDGCDGGTNIIAVMEKGIARPRSASRRQELEDCFLEFFASVKTDLQELIKNSQKHEESLLIRRTPRCSR